MTPQEIPAAYRTILDKAAGGNHSATGPVMTCLAEILTAHERDIRGHLAAMLHERAQQSRTLTHRAIFGIASRLVAPDITPEDIERAIRAGNFVVCDIPDDPARGNS